MTALYMAYLNCEVPLTFPNFFDHHLVTLCSSSYIYSFPFVTYGRQECIKNVSRDGGVRNWHIICV